MLTTKKRVDYPSLWKKGISNRSQFNILKKSQHHTKMYRLLVKFEASSSVADAKRSDSWTVQALQKWL